jgi:rRNA processing protein Krr1/Pno1
VVSDKYLGDALYAAMVYAILRLISRAYSRRTAVTAMAIMTAIEFFQLTMIPAHLLRSPHLIVRICARLIGTEFSFLDLLAYAVGITGIYFASRAMPSESSRYE